MPMSSCGKRRASEGTNGDEIQRAIADLNTLGATITPVEIAALAYQNA